MKKQKGSINKTPKDAVLVFNAEICLGKFCGMKKLHIILLTHS